MTKGTYEVHNKKNIEDPYAQNVQTDNSYRSCLCAMLVFIVLCVIITLIGVKWSGDEIDGIKQSLKKEVELVEDDHTQKSMGPFEKIEFTANTQTKPTRTSNDKEETTSNYVESTTSTTINEISGNYNYSTRSITKYGLSSSTNNFASTSTDYASTQEQIVVEDTNEIDLKTTTFEDNTKVFLTEFSASSDSNLYSTKLDENEAKHVTLEFSTEDVDFTSSTGESYISTDIDLAHLLSLRRASLETKANEYSSTEGVSSENVESFQGKNTDKVENHTTPPPTTLAKLVYLVKNILSQETLIKMKENNEYSSTEGVSSENAESFERKSTEKVLNLTTTPPPPQVTELTMRSPKTDPSQIVISKGKVSSNYQPVCNSPGCISAASRILILMNHSSTACEDFYEFACGGGMQAQSADSDNWEMLSRQLASVKNTPSKYLKELNAFHESCLRHYEYFDYEERMKRVRELAGLVGNFDLGADNVRVDFTDLFAKLVLLQSMPLFDVGLNFDKNSNIYVLQLTLPRKSSLPSGGVEQWSALLENQIRCLNAQQYKIYEPNLNLKLIYDSFVACKKNHEHYLNVMENSVRAFGGFSNFTTFEVEQKMNEMRTTIQDVILKVLDELPEEREIIRAVINNEYKTYKIIDLQNTFKMLDWTKFIKYLVGRELPDDTPIHVFFPAHFIKLFRSFTKTSIKNLHDAFMSIFLTDLYQNFVVPQNKIGGEYHCLKLSTNFFHDVISDLYMNSTSDKTIEENSKFLTDIFTALKDNFKKSLQNSDWLDDSDKRQMVEKVSKMRLILSKKLHNEDDLNKKYREINLGGDFQKNFVTMLNFSRSNVLKLASQNIVEDNLFEHFFSDFHNQPVAFYEKEFIVAPNGIVENIPKKVPGYILMGRVGFHLAKSIGKHFDPTGITYDLSLSEDFRDKYEAMVTKTNVYLSDKRSILMNGHGVEFQAPIEFSANQRIAENTAFKIISDLYVNFGKQDLLPWISFTYSKEKIFFLTVAQEMCTKRSILKETIEIYESNTLPAFLLVENIMSNSKIFSDISGFDCPLGSSMNNNDEQKNQFPHIKIEDDYGENSEDIYRNK